MTSRILSFVVWALVAASLVFWGLRVLAAPRAIDGVAVATSSGATAPWPQLMGAVVAPLPDVPEDELPMAEESRFQLLGLVAARGAPYSNQGVALIAIDGEPAKAFRAGSTVEGETVLLAVDARSAKLGPRGGPATLELSLPDVAELMAGDAGASGMQANGSPDAPHAKPLRPGIHRPQMPGNAAAQQQHDEMNMGDESMDEADMEEEVVE